MKRGKYRCCGNKPHAQKEGLPLCQSYSTDPGQAGQLCCATWSMAKGGRAEAHHTTLLQMLSLPLEDPRERSRFTALQKPSSRVVLPDQTGNLKRKGDKGEKRKARQGERRGWGRRRRGQGAGETQWHISLITNGSGCLKGRVRRPWIIQNTQFCCLTYWNRFIRELTSYF